MPVSVERLACFYPSVTLELIAYRRGLSLSTGASRVVIFDHKTRHGPTNWHSLGAGNQSIRGPILRAHVDQSYAGAEFMARWLLPDEAEELLTRRWQIINVGTSTEAFPVFGGA